MSSGRAKRPARRRSSHLGRFLALLTGLVMVFGLAFAVPGSPAVAATLVDTITVSGWPYGIAVTPDGAYVYVTDRDGDTVSVIDTSTNTVTGSPITVGGYPYDVVITPDGAFAYVSNSDSATVSVIDTTQGAVVATIPVGSGPYGMAISPDGSLVYVANFNGPSVSVIDTSSNTVTTTFSVPGQPRCVAVTPDGLTAYVTNSSGSNTVSVIDTVTNTVTTTIAVGAVPLGVVITPDGSAVYVANQGNNSVSVIDPTTNAVIGSPISPSYGAFGLAISPDGAFVYSAASNGARVDVISTSSNSIVESVTTGSGPTNVAISPDGHFAYVTLGRTPGAVGVIALDFAPTITTTSPLAAATVDRPHTTTIEATGYPAPTFSLTGGSLPPGLTLAADGTLSGTPTVSGTYSFTVTATNSVYGQPANDAVTFVMDVVLPRYTVTFHANGGSGVMVAQTSDAPAALDANAFTQNGFSFTGWNTAAGGTGTSYANGATFPFDRDVTLYAQWQPIQTPPPPPGPEQPTPPPPSPDGTLPYTGANVGPWALLSVLSLLAGAVLCVGAYRLTYVKRH